MGWTGDSGMYVPRSVLDAGEATGDAMEYYKSYNARVMAEQAGQESCQTVGRLARALEVLRQHQQDREHQRRVHAMLRHSVGDE